MRRQIIHPILFVAVARERTVETWMTFREDAMRLHRSTAGYSLWASDLLFFDSIAGKPRNGIIVIHKSKESLRQGNDRSAHGRGFLYKEAPLVWTVFKGTLLPFLFLRMPCNEDKSLSTYTCLAARRTTPIRLTSLTPPCSHLRRKRGHGGR